jgi:hypothetical protein
MSAFLVADKTNRVMYWLSVEVGKSEYLRQKVEAGLGINTTKPNWEDELGKERQKPFENSITIIRWLQAPRYRSQLSIGYGDLFIEKEVNSVAYLPCL